MFCGDGFLDNLKGQNGGCATPTSYGCEPFDVEKEDTKEIIRGIQVAFDTNIFCGADQVSNAVKEATAHIPGNCENMGNSGSTDPKDIITAIVGAISGLPGFNPVKAPGTK